MQAISQQYEDSSTVMWDYSGEYFVIFEGSLRPGQKFLAAIE